MVDVSKEELVVIDWRCLASVCSYSIMSGNEMCTDPVEVNEIAYRLMKRLLCIRLDHPTAKFVIANDSRPYWRTKYLEQWYADRPQLEPVVYKGNRVNSEWRFETPKEDMEEMYSSLLKDALNLLSLHEVTIPTLEADDIWGVYSEMPYKKITGYTTDHDWAQKCKTGKIYVHGLITNEVTDQALDMRPYYLGGDIGDGLKGCPKYTKAGTQGKNGWAIKGATKFIAENPDSWMDVTDRDHIDKNEHLMKLPCPTWNLKQVIPAMLGKEIKPVKLEDKEKVWSKYRLVPALRMKLYDVANRQVTVESYRSNLQSKLQENKDKVSKLKQSALSDVVE